MLFVVSLRDKTIPPSDAFRPARAAPRLTKRLPLFGPKILKIHRPPRSAPVWGEGAQARLWCGLAGRVHEYLGTKEGKARRRLGGRCAGFRALWGCVPVSL